MRVVMAPQFTYFGWCEAAQCTSCLCDVVALVLDVLLGLVFLVDGFNVSLQFLISTKFMSTCLTFIFPDSFMNNLYMSSKVLFETKCHITMLTFIVLDFFMNNLCVVTQILPRKCSIITHWTFEISSFLMDQLHVTCYTGLVLWGVLAVRAKVVRVLGHVALLLSPLQPIMALSTCTNWISRALKRCHDSRVHDR